MQEVLESDVYIDDVGAFDDSWENRLETLERILTRLQVNNFTVNPLNCELAIQETDWIGYWLTPSGLKSTPNGLKPCKKKIEAILKIEAPRKV